MIRKKRIVNERIVRRRLVRSRVPFGPIDIQVSYPTSLTGTNSTTAFRAGARNNADYLLFIFKPDVCEGVGQFLGTLPVVVVTKRFHGDFEAAQIALAL
jgi:hypothetical protein